MITGRIASRRLWPALSGAWAIALVLAPFAGASTPRAAPIHALASPLLRYADGAPPGFTGGFKEQSCHACHFEAEPNAAPGTLTLEGVPERFTPGERYTLAVTLARPGIAIAGFQLAARFDDGSQAGTLERTSEDMARVKVETQSGVQYAGQQRAGATPAEGKARWTLVWTAPQDARAVTFHVAANAADNDESVRGDYVYTATVKAEPR